MFAFRAVNYSLYAIPAYYALALVPHTYSAVIVSSQTKKYDNTNPRGTKHMASVQKNLSPPMYQKYERCRACHHNSMENMAFFVGAVLAGNMLKLSPVFMNTWVIATLALRVAHTVAYIGIEDLKLSLVRSVLYTGATLTQFVIYVAAAKKLASGGLL